MKTALALTCVAAISGALISGAAIGRPTVNLTADAALSTVALEAPISAPQRASAKPAALRAHGELGALKSTVVSEMRATKAFVKANVVKEESADRGLMLLAAVGMIVLQLRRKHKSLPQRQIVPYA